MIIPCPHCQVRLNLPEDVEGKQVRCPSCKEVFRANKEVLEEAVQAGLPEPTPTSVTSRPRAEEDEEREPPRSRPRYRDYGDDEDGDDGRDRDDYDRRDIERDTEAVRAQAKRVARPAGYFMAAACIFTGINIAGNAVLSFLSQQEMGPPPPGVPGPGAMIGLMVICLAVIFGPILIFIGLGSKCLFTLGSRGLIITAIVMNFILLLVMGGGLVINIIALAAGNLPVPIHLVLPTVVMNSFTCIANLGAAVLSIRVLINADVSEAYAMQQEDISRRRRY